MNNTKPPLNLMPPMCEDFREKGVKAWPQRGNAKTTLKSSVIASLR